MEDRLTQLIQWAQEAEDASADSRALAERDRDYYDNIQWTTAEIAELKKRGQPVITINRVKRKIDFLTGIEKQQRSDPKAFPRNPADEEAASAASDSIRYIEEKNKFDSIASEVWEKMLIEGRGTVDVGVYFKGDDPEIFINYVAWDRSFIDPYSSIKSGEDARYKGAVIWQDVEQAIKKWPKGKALFEQTLSEGRTDDTYDDKPKHTLWADSARKRVKVVMMWYREGSEWHWSLFTKAGEVKGGPSPYRTQDGESLCGHISRSAYMDRDNNSYGVVREMISPQDEINKRRSKLLHQLNARQTIGESGAVEDVRKMKSEMSKPDGHVEVVPALRFEVLDNNDQTAGQFNLLQEAKQEIDLMGPNASMTGKSDKGVESGRAIQAQQQGGFIELATLLDGYRMWKLEVYEMIWHLVRQYWTAEKWLRVTDDENNMKFVGINKPIPIGQIYGYPPEVIERNPQLQQPSGEIENDVAKLDVDIMIEDAPDTITIQHEQFQELVGLAQAGVPFPPDLLIEASQLRNKKELLEKLKGGDNPEQAEQQAAEAERQREIEDTAVSLDFKQKEATIRKTTAEAIETEVNIGAPQ